MERLDHFMARANAAYYASHDPFADFTTAPEITQVFGELLGAWAAVQWQAMGEPNPVLLVEAGPGRGTLMADALRAAAVLPAFRAAVQVHLIETSPRLRALQAGLVPRAVWHDTLRGVPPGPMILLANEFLDALPIRQFVWRAETWSERYVQDSTYVEQPPSPLRGEGWGGVLDPTMIAGPEGFYLPKPERQPQHDVLVYEVNEPALAFVCSMAQRLCSQGGSALFLDYGPAQSAPGESLQALRRGKPAKPLEAPGEADLTAHVDFTALATAARAEGAAVYGPRAQGLFLAELGLFQRTGRLAQNLPAAKAAALIQSAQRLAEPDRMGRLFQALVIQHPNIPSPPGFP